MYKRTGPLILYIHICLGLYPKEIITVFQKRCWENLQSINALTFFHIQKHTFTNISVCACSKLGYTKSPNRRTFSIEPHFVGVPYLMQPSNTMDPNLYIVRKVGSHQYQYLWFIRNFTYPTAAKSLIIFKRLEIFLMVLTQTTYNSKLSNPLEEMIHC